MPTQNQFQLFRQRRFAPLFVTQFFGAFNDNLFKNALIILITYQAGDLLVGDTNTLVNLCAGLFILPFFLFSATAGQFADKFEKARLIRGIKLFEVLIMMAGAIGFIVFQIPFLIFVLFFMGLQSAVFGPVKYGILPQHLNEEELVGGNGMLEMGTFVAILLGTMLGGILIGIDDLGTTVIAIVLVTVALLGYLSSRFIPAAPCADPGLRINWNPISETWNIYRHVRNNRTVYLSILGVSWFWFFGAIYLTQLPNYTKLHLYANEQVVTLMLTLFSCGIGIGSMLCERLSGHKVELGLVPFGSIGLTWFGVDLFFAANQLMPTIGSLNGFTAFVTSAASWRVILDVVLLGMFGGFYVVPLYALIQQRSDKAFRSRTIAGNNILNALFMVIASVFTVMVLKAGADINTLLLTVAGLNAVVAIYIYTLVPEFLMRFIVWMLIHTVYRVKKTGLENIPDEGAALLVCNHVSLVDALVIAACVRRPARFIMYYKIFQIPLLRFVFKTAKAIPIASQKEDAGLLKRAYEDISQALKEGELVCIFPEGRLTSDGEINPFKPGVLNILEKDPVPVIPMALKGLWGSFFSRKDGTAMSAIPKRFWSKIALEVGAPIGPENIQLATMRQRVADLRGDWC